MHQTRPIFALLYLHLLLFLCCFASLNFACHQVDHDSLLSFHLTLTVSSPPLNWSTTTDCCFWEGIRCNSNDQVTHLHLPQRGLTGNISPFLGNLTHLSDLNLSGNHLMGPLPSEFLSLISLETLDLSYNRLSGSLPPSLPFKFIRTIDLSSNYFNGEISRRFFLQTQSLTSFNISNNTFTALLPLSACINVSQSMQILDVSHNNFHGQIPLGFGMCSKLLVFKAGFNSLSGPIPSDMYSATQLQELSLPVNNLSGPISNDLTRLRNLKILELWANELDRLIPENIGSLFKLESLLLHSNSLTGPLPLSLMNCTNLLSLNLRANHLEGNLSDFNFSKLGQLQSVDLGNNNFTGVIPQSLYSCKSLTAIRLSFNKLEGQFSPDVASLQSLTYLSVSNNKLTNVTGALKLLAACTNLRTLLLSANFENETLPNDENLIQSDQFQNLLSLGILGCYLVGQVPVWLIKLKKLKFLEMSRNQLTGSIPGWLGSLPNLFYINLSENLLSSEFPVELCKLPAMESGGTSLELPVFLMPKPPASRQYNTLSSIPPSIRLARNNLTGNIPPEISQLKFLHVLDLSHNNFSGKIPEQISQLTNLEMLDLSGNNLSGEIPQSLRGLHFLSEFSVANNNLTGPVPSGGQFDTFPNSSFEGNPGLCGSVVQHSFYDQEPKITETEMKSESYRDELSIGLMSGVIFGFLVGSTIGLQFPIHKRIKKLLVQSFRRKQATIPKAYSRGHNLLYS